MRRLSASEILSMELICILFVTVDSMPLIPHLIFCMEKSTCFLYRIRRGNRALVSAALHSYFTTAVRIKLCKVFPGVDDLRERLSFQGIFFV